MKKENDPIRIAHIIGKWVGGGVEAVIMNYYRNIDHSIIKFDFICDDDSIDIPYKEIESLGGKVILIPAYQRIFKYKKKLKKELKKGNYKIVHSHINTLSVFPLKVAKKTGIPIRIAHSHSTTSKKEWKKNLIKSLLRPFSKLYATDYFACTEHAGRWLFGNRTFDQKKVFVMNNAIDLEKFKYDENIRKSKRKELGIKEDTLVIGHIGRFVAQKNHTFLIDIFNKLHEKNDNSVLLLVGQGPLEEEMKEKVNNLGLSKHIRFLGQRNDVNELYQAFDIFLFPSLYEGLGNVLIEAQCARNYCVASNEVPSVAKITDNLTFIDLNCSESEWASKIIDVLELKKDINSKQISDSGYDIKKEVIVLKDMYDGMREIVWK